MKGVLPFSSRSNAPTNERKLNKEEITYFQSTLQVGCPCPATCCYWYYDDGTWTASCPNTRGKRWTTRSFCENGWNVRSAAKENVSVINWAAGRFDSTHFQVKTGHDGQFLHRQLLGRLLITRTTRAFDFGRRSQVFRTGEPFQTIDQRRWGRQGIFALAAGSSCAAASGAAAVGAAVAHFGAGRCSQVQWNVPKWIDCRWHSTAKRKKGKRRQTLSCEIFGPELWVVLLARLTNDIRLQSASENLIDDAVAPIDWIVILRVR